MTKLEKLPASFKKVAMHMPDSKEERLMGFLQAMKDLPIGSSYTLRIGMAGEDADHLEPIVVFTVMDTNHIFTVPEARIMAQTAEDTMNKYPEVGAMAFADLAMGIRAACDKIEAVNDATK